MNYIIFISVILLIKITLSQNFFFFGENFAWDFFEFFILF